MSNSSGLLGVLEADINGLKATIEDAEEKGVDPNTLHNVVELATLRVFSVLETFLQDLFYLCVLNDASVPGSGAMVQVGTREEANLLLLNSGGRREKFLSWLPIDRTIEMADTYLLDGHPFERLKYRPIENRELDELTVVRNAVAHPSDHAHSALVRLASSKGYPTNRAADYLLSTRGGQQEVLLLMTRAQVVARGLAAFSETEADGILEPEMEFQSSAKAPMGTFVCVRCQFQRILSVEGKLGACPSCENPRLPCSECGRRTAPTSTWRRTQH